MSTTHAGRVAVTDGWLTRDQVVDALQTRGFDVSTRTLSFWQTRGWLPYPVRRYHDGATRAWYPPETVDRLVSLLTAPKRRIGSRSARAGTAPKRQSGAAPGPLRQRMADLERRVAALEAGQAVQQKGGE
jgi:DNA-binding transcriptional MerR regulator